MIQLLAAESEPMGLGQVAGGLGLAKGTAHGLLRTLCAVGFVEQNAAGRYRLGAELLQLGSTTLDLNELRSITLNWVDTLAARTGQAAGLAAYRGGRAVFAHYVPRGDPGSSATGDRHPASRADDTLELHASAYGKVLLAFDPGAARSIVGQELVSLTFRTITDRPRLLNELATIRDAGAATAIEEAEPGLAEIAAPVRDRGGYVVAAVGIDGPDRSLCDERLRPRADMIKEVVAISRSLSRALGHGVAL